MDHAETSKLGMNGSGTDSKSDTPLTQARSGFDLAAARADLIALRVKYGADTPIGHRCSNLIEELAAYETVKGFDWTIRQQLYDAIMRSMAELAELTSNQ